MRISASVRSLGLLLVVGFSYCTLAYGQKRTVYSGTVFSSDTSLLLRGINILNLNSKERNVSDAYGNFVLDYKFGDTLEFRHDHWETKRVFGDKLTDSIFLRKRSVVLDEIVITRNRRNKEIDGLEDIQKEKNKKAGIYYGGRPPIALLNPFGGKPITFFYELLSKNGKRARAMEKNIQLAIKESKIDSVFNKNAVKMSTSIKDEDIATFMEAYRPTFEQVQTWNTYDLYHYIQKSYKSFTSAKRE